MVQVVVPLIVGDVAEALFAAQRAQAGGADLVELRLDRCAGLGVSLTDLIAAIPTLPLPVIATIRHRSEGGEWEAGEDERFKLFAAADAAGAAYIDIELALLGEFKPKRARLILSHHDFQGMGTDLAGIVARMHCAGAAVAKLAVTAADAADLAVIEQLYQAPPCPLAAIAMGDHGLPSRLLAGAWGAALTFARLDDSEGSAPGQPTLRELLDVYHVKKQGPETRIFGVIGSPIGHSLSPLIHNAAFAQHQLDAVYVPFLVEDPVAFWRTCGEWIDGLSITIPHKHALLGEVDRLEGLAKRIGAINTIYRDEQGSTIGANTDANAAVSCIERQAGTLADRQVTMLGAGGAARAIAFAVADRGAHLTIANRSLDRAQELASDIGGAANAVTMEQAPATPYDVLINGTAVGMGKDGESPWPAEAHRANAVVFDTVYTPLETRLLKDAQMAGATTICGLSMFIAQALGQYQRWTGVDAPESLMQRVALERLSRSEGPDHNKHSTATLERRLGGATL